MDEVDPHIIHISSSMQDHRLEILDLRMKNESGAQFRHEIKHWDGDFMQLCLRLY